MCRGKSDEKAELLVDICMGQDLVKKEKPKPKAEENGELVIESKETEKPKEKGAFGMKMPVMEMPIIEMPVIKIDGFENMLGNGPEEEVISFMNPRLVTSIKYLIYFSEIFPKKYMKNFIPVSQMPIDIRSPRNVSKDDNESKGESCFSSQGSQREYIKSVAGNFSSFKYR